MDEKPQLRRSNKVDDVREDSELEGLSQMKKIIRKTD